MMEAVFFSKGRRIWGSEDGVRFLGVQVGERILLPDQSEDSTGGDDMPWCRTVVFDKVINLVKNRIEFEVGLA